MSHGTSVRRGLCTDVPVTGEGWVHCRWEPLAARAGSECFWEGLRLSGEPCEGAGRSAPLQGEKRKDRRFLKHHESNRPWAGHRRRAADGLAGQGTLPSRSTVCQALCLALLQLGDPQSCLVLPWHRILAGHPSSSLAYLVEGAAHLFGAVCPELVALDRPQQVY